ncbi:MAG: hypothetical protein ACFFB5_04325 [Promethearchaeota archaeon]
MANNNPEKSESDPVQKLANRSKNRVKLDAKRLTQLWINAEKEIKEAYSQDSLRKKEEFSKRRKWKRITPPNPKILAKWWQEADNHIRLAHPHESLKIRQELTEKYVLSRLKKHLEKQKQYKEPHPEEKQISEWYDEELLKLREEIPHKPLKEREKIASAIVEEKIRQYRKTIRLDEFLD